MEPEYVTVQEAAELLGVNRRTITNMITDGRLEVRESPIDRRQRLVPRSQIESMLRIVGPKQKKSQ